MGKDKSEVNSSAGLRDEGQSRESVCAGSIKRETRKPRLKRINRQQLVMRPMDVEQLVPEDHEVRAIWEFVGCLDLSRYYEDIEVIEGEAGRPALAPRLMISLWLYAYSKGIGSAREVSRLCEYDPAYQWLTGMEPINYHTLPIDRPDRIRRAVRLLA